MTIIIDVRPTPRRRSGLKMKLSEQPPATMAARMPRTAASRMWIRGPYWLKYQATMAPRATSSPWAKLDRPVVP